MVNRLSFPLPIEPARDMTNNTQNPIRPPLRQGREGLSAPGGEAPSPPRSPDNIFSDDEVEAEFLHEIRSDRKPEWDDSRMPWNKIHNCPWVRCEQLGSGSFGSVYLGQRSQDQKVFAVKSIGVSPWAQVETRRLKIHIQELSIMRHLKYKYIVRCFGCGRSNGDNAFRNGQDTLDVFLEYIIRGSLSQVVSRRRLGPLEEDPYVRQYTYDILKALQFMETRHVVHGDIKMQNLLLADDCVKLADWGGAKILDDYNLAVMLIGTLGYMPPEVAFGIYQNHSSDIFSLGCTVIEMLTSSPPAAVMTVVPTNVLHKRRLQTRNIIPAFVSPMCRDFLELCFMWPSTGRWTAEELLLHPFIADRNKLDPLPYQMSIPPQIQASLLTHPHPGHPVLPDPTTPTARVRNHLETLRPFTLPALAPGPPAAPPVAPPAPIILMSSSSSSSPPRPAIPPATHIDLSSSSSSSAPHRPGQPPAGIPAPLPNFQPEFTVNKNSRLSDRFVAELPAETRTSRGAASPPPRDDVEVRSACRLAGRKEGVASRPRQYQPALEPQTGVYYGNLWDWMDYVEQLEILPGLMDSVNEDNVRTATAAVANAPEPDMTLAELATFLSLSDPGTVLGEALAPGQGVVQAPTARLGPSRALVGIADYLPGCNVGGCASGVALNTVERLTESGSGSRAKKKQKIDY